MLLGLSAFMTPQDSVNSKHPALLAKRLFHASLFTALAFLFAPTLAFSSQSCEDAFAPQAILSQPALGENSGSSYDPALARVIADMRMNVLTQRRDIDAYYEDGREKAETSINRILNLSKRLQVDIDTIASNFPPNSVVHKVLMISREGISLGENGQKHLQELKTQYGSNSLDALPPLERQRIRSHLHGIEGEFAELMIAFSVEGLESKSVAAKNLPEVQEALVTSKHNNISDYFKALFPNATGVMQETDLDIVFKDGRAWGEVKSFKTVLSTSDARWEKILVQAKRIAELKAGLTNGFEWQQMKVKPRVEEIHFFCIHGMTTEAAETLKSLGFVVHGPIYPQ